MNKKTPEADAEGERVLYELVSILEARLPPDHPWLASAKALCGHLLSALGATDPSTEKMLRAALEHDLHPAFIQSHLGQCLMRMGNYPGRRI